MNKAQSTPLVAVIATGGTIASKRGDNGASTPTLSGKDLLALLPDAAADLRAIELMAKDSASLTLADMQRISNAVKAELDDTAVQGVVVLHGTDAMEETALLVHLQHRIARPVVLPARNSRPIIPMPTARPISQPPSRSPATTQMLTGASLSHSAVASCLSGVHSNTAATAPTRSAPPATCGMRRP